jgi:hypothetical protein
MIQVNAKGFAIIQGRNWSYAGDKRSYAMVKTDDDGNQVSLVVKRADKGLISSEYDAAMNSFCAEHGINWSAVRCGQQVEVNL